MDHTFEEILLTLEAAFSKLESLVPKPVLISIGQSRGFRYLEKSIQQAIILKLARYVSGLYSAKILLNNGMFQEQGVIQRTLDEFFEDILFLTHGIKSEFTDLHKRFLQTFFQEEFDDSLKRNSLKRDMVPRKKIRAYIARMEEPELDLNQGVELAKTIYSVYSGYVHGAAPHILEMYGGQPKSFHLRGFPCSGLVGDHQTDIWNYFYRGILATSYVGIALGAQSLVEHLLNYKKKVEEEAGKDYD